MNVWVEAARPRTLSAGLAPVLVGTAAAEAFIAWRFVAALVVGVSIQIGVNYANDLFDAERGVDTGERLGPRRAVAAGLVSPARMRVALTVVLLVAGAAGLALALATTLWLLVIGLLCFAALVGYSGGPRPFASAGLGEVFVFLFFGLVATVGSAFVQSEAITVVAVVAAIPVGLLAVALLVINNLRDIPTDRAAGKHTLAVRIGERRTRMLYGALLVATPAALTGLAGADESLWPLLGWGCAPLLVKSGLVAREAGGRDLVPALGATGLAQLVLGVLVAVGLWIS
ncbi:MAG: 1,4-dihydroxy-2-naphthoate polyprenyltransferase [Actinomycetota bacterium]